MHQRFPNGRGVQKLPAFARPSLIICSRTIQIERNLFSRFFAGIVVKHLHPAAYRKVNGCAVSRILDDQLAVVYPPFLAAVILGREFILAGLIVAALLMVVDLLDLGSDFRIGRRSLWER